jgi:hypothetical protein
MTTSTNQKIVTRGLKYAWDMNNKKSWKGKPTTNLLSNPDFSNGTTGWTLTSRSSSTHSDTMEIRYEPDGTPYLNMHLERTSGSGNSWSHLRQGSVFSSTGNYATSGQFRVNAYSVSSGSTLSQFRGSAFYNDWWSANRPVRNISASDIGQGWLDLELNRDYVSSYTRDGTVYNLDGCFEFYTGSMPAVGDLIDIDIRLIQIESGTFATPFVNGTRTNTNSLRDMTSSNTLTLSALTYNSDGTFEFDQSASNRITSDKLMRTLMDSVDTYTYSCVIKRTASMPDGHGVALGLQGYNCGILLKNDGIIASNWYNNGSGYSVKQSGTATLANNTWAHATMTWNCRENMKLYINGELTHTVSVSAQTGSSNNDWYGVTSAHSNPIMAGGGSSHWETNSVIKEAQVYDRELSAEEVKQNFIAVRGKYGL